MIYSHVCNFHIVTYIYITYLLFWGGERVLPWIPFAKGADLDEVVPVAEPFFENSLEDYLRNLHDAS